MPTRRPTKLEQEEEEEEEQQQQREEQRDGHRLQVLEICKAIFDDSPVGYFGGLAGFCAIHPGDCRRQSGRSERFLKATKIAKKGFPFFTQMRYAQCGRRRTQNFASAAPTTSPPPSSTTSPSGTGCGSGSGSGIGIGIATDTLSGNASGLSPWQRQRPRRLGSPASGAVGGQLGPAEVSQRDRSRRRIVFERIISLRVC
ncbi:hypothetical protein AWZ03_006258 [Drosophila navojoa]|uniref:Uncharacterized protein n=1 Tax=Drosophila navojoa TaxID=7232 RepID=A0A484BHI9_DRONA|nr:hypothetical protein AWZ03_006258 [Drosophila navojoa]